MPARTAQADPPGITSTLLLDGTTYNGVPVVNEDSTVTLRVQYQNTVAPGSTVDFVVGPNATLTGVPATNTAIASVVQSGNTVSITFKDPFPADVDQGVFDLKLTVNQVVTSVEVPISWTVAGDTTSIDVIVKNGGDQFANVSDAQAKSVSPTNLDSFVTVVAGAVTLKPEISAQELTYTLRLDSSAVRTGFAISDQLPTGLDYVAGSFAGLLTTWDPAGLNRATAPFAFVPTVTGNAFSGTVTVPGPSILALTYKAKVTDAAALEAALQAKYDLLGGSTGNFEISVTNTASFDGISKTAAVRLRGNVAGVNVGAAFAKNADWSTKNVIADESGNLTPPIDITYTLRADLRAWDGNGVNFTLARNVVISDSLPTQATWNTAAPDFITSTGISLTFAGTCPDATAFAADAFVGQYCLAGQLLLVNVGKDNTTNASIAVKSQLTTVAALTPTGSTTIEDAVPYRWRNIAEFNYRSGSPYTATRDVTVVVLPDSTGGVNDSSVFTKTGAAVDATVAPGESVTVSYTFKVTAGKGIDVRASKIVDYIDSDIFEISDPTAVVISGTYDGQALAPADFALSGGADGNLIIELSGTGTAIVDLRGPDKAYTVNISLTTKPFVGKQTKTISNTATLFGEGSEPLYRSATSAEATSFGDEAEIRKRVYDPETATWVESLAASMNGPASLVEDEYVYRVEFIPRGAFNNVVIIPVTDVLPAAVDFLGFLAEGDAAAVSPLLPGPVDVGGNLEARYDGPSHTVTIAQKNGTRLNVGSPIAAYFGVKVNNASAPIINRIGSTAASIVPIKSVSVGDYVWVDSDRNGRQNVGEPGIAGVVLILVGPDGEPVTDVLGVPVGPATTDVDGGYTFDNLPALTGEQVYTVRIDQVASAVALKPYVPTTAGAGDRKADSSTGQASTVPGELHLNEDRDPTLDFGFVLKSYAIGDYVWIDTNKNGLQDAAEVPLAGVRVELLDSVGEVLGVTQTDAGGRYVFDGLTAGTYRVRFTLTDDQRTVYEFTQRDLGTSNAVDSDANPADGLTAEIVLDDSNDNLTTMYDYRSIGASQGIDPTWDAGVVVKQLPEAQPPVQPPGNLPITGATIAMGMIAAALALLAVGGVFQRVGRRRVL
ncbi:MAG TPA: SdrD B-like domain-containing protein [Ilumatobacteraceae bacterium]|nr:SdrD B-like domain-containing protein [Ilumatobacteraceae bacterium]